MSAGTSNTGAASAHETKTSLQLLVLGALGVVYGDIGRQPPVRIQRAFCR